MVLAWVCHALFGVVAGAGAQVNRCGDVGVSYNGFVEAAVGVRVVEGELCWWDDAISVLLNFFGSGAGSATFIRNRVFVGVLGWVRIDQGAWIDTTESGVYVPPVLISAGCVREQLEELIAGGVGPLLLGQCKETSGKRS